MKTIYNTDITSIKVNNEVNLYLGENSIVGR